MRGKEFIEYDNPFDVGMTGLLGFSSGYHAMMDCETLADARHGFSLSAVLPQGRDRSIQIDLRGEQLGRRTQGRLRFCRGYRDNALRALLPNLEQNRTRGISRTSVEHYRKAREGLR